MTAHLYDTLIEPAELAALLDDPDVAVVDCRHELAQPEWGAQAYAQAHIPGALFAHLDRDLSGPVTPQSGRHPLPTFESLARTASAWGIDSGVQVIAYDQGPGAYAARLWWLLRYFGHGKVSVLDGGITRWVAEGRPLTTVVPELEPGVFVARPDETRVVDRDAVRRLSRNAGTVVLDARAPERYEGRSEPTSWLSGRPHIL